VRKWGQKSWTSSPGLSGDLDQDAQVPGAPTDSCGRLRAGSSGWDELLGEQEIEREGLLWRRLGRGRGRRHRRARVVTGWRWSVIFLAQRGARCVSRRRGEPGARRRVERTLASARGKPERCHHGSHQGQPAPSVDGLFHWHPTCPQPPSALAEEGAASQQPRRTIPDRRGNASIASMNSQVFLFPPIFCFRPAATTISLPDFGHFSARCRRSSSGSQPSARPTTP
jgi:hypothetical protein